MTEMCDYYLNVIKNQIESCMDYGIEKYGYPDYLLDALVRLHYSITKCYFQQAQNAIRSIIMFKLMVS